MFVREDADVPMSDGVGNMTSFVCVLKIAGWVVVDTEDVDLSVEMKTDVADEFIGMAMVDAVVSVCI